MQHWIRRITALLAATAIQLYAAAGYYAWKLPDSYYISTGGTLTLSAALPISATETDPKIQTASAAVSDGSAVQSVSLRLFGIIPIKNAELQEIQTPQLIPGGQPFGIKLHMDGVMIVRTAAIDSANGSCCPAQQAGLLPGDIIRTVNHTPISSNAELSACIRNGGGSTVTIEYLRDETPGTVRLTPAYSINDQCYTAGIWVRDSLAGVGTMTFYDTATGSFGGLGHPICDADTGTRIPISEGAACPVTISGCAPSISGTPGMLQGTFLQGAPLGTLTCNSPCGVFGKLTTSPDPLSASTAALPMALKQEVVPGDAELLCTISGTTLRRCTVTIEKIDYTGTDNTKNMILHITDPDLLRDCGGIVQGMSGSPILQNGKLVGAVTHVFVDDPSRGYGIFCENMYRTCLSGT